MLWDGLAVLAVWLLRWLFQVSYAWLTRISKTDLLVPILLWRRR